jgi:hypothetical protein
VTSVRLSIVILVVWLILIGVAIWPYAEMEVEPPAWDALSYAAKAASFWNAIDHRHFFNPFNLAPTGRPPGTVLMSYPFGFSNDFNAYYFRSIFFPIVLLAAAPYIACYHSGASSRSCWILAVLALAFCGMPVLYQFELNDALPGISFWGLVDNFLGGVAAISVAAAIRSVRRLSVGWAIGAATTAAICLLVKPAGILVIVVVGTTWLILFGFVIGWDLASLRQEPALRRFFGIGLTSAVIIFTLSFAAAFSSKYLSAANIGYGERAVAVLKSDFAPAINFDQLLSLTEYSFGYVVPVLFAAGMLSALFSRGDKGLLVAAVFCLIIGIWFWLVETGIQQIRYFLPFGYMAFVIIVPVLDRRMRLLSGAATLALGALLLAPIFAVTALLLSSRPSVALQRTLHVNLTSGAFRAENNQAAAFLTMVQNEGPRSVYMFQLNSTARNFSAVVGYWTYFDQWRVRTIVRLPIDWARSTTFRFSEIATSDFLLFEPIENDAARQSILEINKIDSFDEETLLMRAWLSTLGSDEGLALVSQTRLRLLRIVDRGSFERALLQLRKAHDWRQAFREANP